MGKTKTKKYKVAWFYWEDYIPLGMAHDYLTDLAEIVAQMRGYGHYKIESYKIIPDKNKTIAERIFFEMSGCFADEPGVCEWLEVEYKEGEVTVWRVEE